MRSIVGVQIVAGGDVTVLGHPAGSPQLRGLIGYATQNPAIYADLTITEALRYFTSVLRAPLSDVDRLLVEVGLAEHAGKLVGSLSGGQHSRANLAVALLGKPELLVLDEPTVGLDPVLRDELWSQLRHDPRTVAMLVVVPSLLMVLLRFVFNSEAVFSRVAPALLGVFPFLIMFLITSITTLRERTTATLERLMTLPIGRLDLLFGYAIAFGSIAVVQVGVAAGISLAWLGLDIAGSIGMLLLITVLDALLGMALGLFVSAFARTGTRH
ncbi:hypothetical protein HDA45_001594 [Amycolatopsis umgeniensis]|uniref:Uncharacterized protein n=1 Tax=Amycolatopsis umgeniensis TaxID=336628 RepID=A0A841AX14_9PSEU|nr:hypothetical protein [Amycolatopsis umgeniensis]